MEKTYLKAMVLAGFRLRGIQVKAGDVVKITPTEWERYENFLTLVSADTKATPLAVEK